MTESRNLAARMGHWSATHRTTALWGWFAFVLLSFVIGTMVIGAKQLDPAKAGVGESGRMDKILADEFEAPAGERVMVQSKALDARSAEFKAVIADVVRRLDAAPNVSKTTSPLEQEGVDLVSLDGHTALVDAEIAGDPDDAVDKIGPVAAAVKASQTAHPDYDIESFGVTAEQQVDNAFTDALKRAGELSIPI